MSPIPLAAIGDIVSFSICLFVTVKLSLSYSVKKSSQLKYFLSFYLSLAIFFGLNIVAGMGFGGEPKIIQALLLAAYFPLYLSALFIILLVFNILKKQKLKKKLIYVIVSLAFLTTFLGILDFRPAASFIYEFQGIEFISWVDSLNPYLRIPAGLITLTIAVVVGLFFINRGAQSEDLFVRKRSWLLGWGIIFLAFASVSFYIANFIIPKESFWLVLIASLFSAVGLLIIMKGVYLSQTQGEGIE